MKQKLILFDIDGTLFDPKLFLESFYTRLSNQFNLTPERIDQIKTYYQQTKVEYSYFNPGVFLKTISQNFPIITEEKLNNIFWDQKMFTSSFYSDIDVLERLSKIAKIGIFSKGDSKFQREKLVSIQEWLSEEHIHVFINKIDRISQVLAKYRDFKTYLVDDDPDVLFQAKEFNSLIFAIQIVRVENQPKNDRIDRIIDSLYQLETIINE
jgi:hypothetical protein